MNNGAIMPFSLPVFGGLAVLLLFGLGLLIWGWRGRRRGDYPACRKCDYNLTGIDADQCPECGAVLTGKATVRGGRRRFVLPLVVGALLLAVSIGIGVPRAVSTDWYPVWPTRLLLAELRLGNAQRFTRAWNELSARERSGTLSAAHWEALIEQCFLEQAEETNPTASQRMIDYLGECGVNGRLSPEQRRRMFEQIPGPTLVVRERVRVGDPVPTFLKDHPDERRRRSTHYTCWSRIVRRRIDSDDERSTISEPGMHTVEVDAELAIHEMVPDGPGARRSSKEPVFVQEVALWGAFEGYVEDPVALLTAEQKTQIVSAISIRCTTEALWITREPTDFPWQVNLALSSDDAQAQLTLRSSRFTASEITQYSHNLNLTVGQHVSVLLYDGDGATVRWTTDLYHYWDGYVTIDEVPVEDVSAMAGVTPHSFTTVMRSWPE